ncbi:hypothetical protein ES695_21175 [Candidatus Atribacteria bacterium 1244-E10-H5-B2]|nr:MAG: hypothetical protein ES695_21175 [Candidatus Atribacteria bacterium 1244-E10-H5-B2]
MKAPKHLSKSSRKFFKNTIENYELEDHHIKLLILACESLDKIEIARRTIAKSALVYVDRFDKPKINPAAKIEIDNKAIFIKLLKAMELDIEPPGEVGRPPGPYR